VHFWFCRHKVMGQRLASWCVWLRPYLGHKQVLQRPPRQQQLLWLLGLQTLTLLCLLYRLQCALQRPLLHTDNQHHRVSVLLSATITVQIWIFCLVLSLSWPRLVNMIACLRWNLQLTLFKKQHFSHVSLESSVNPLLFVYVCAWR
jgi:hypothetical protein